MSDIDYSTVGDDFAGSASEDDLEPEVDADDVFDDEPEATDDAEVEVTDDDLLAEDDEELPDTPATKGNFTKLRNEAKNLRDRVRPFEEAFDGLSDDQRQAFLASAQMYRESPLQWAQAMQQVVTDLLGGDAPSQEEVPEGATDDDGLPFKSKAEFEKYLEERDAKREQARTAQERDQQIRAEIQAEAKALGVEPDTPDYASLVAYAGAMGAKSLKEAHDALEAKALERARAIVRAKKEAAEKSPKVVSGRQAVDKAPKLKFDSPEWRAWADSMG